MLYLLDGNRVDTSKGFVEHDELRVDGKTACYLRTTAFATRQLVAKILAHLAQIEVGNKFLQLLKLLLACEIGHLEHRHNVVFDAQFAEYARLLRQVSYAGACTLVHWEAGYVLVVDVYVSAVGHDESCGHIERCGLSCSVRSQKSYNLALANIYRHVVDNGTLAITLHKSFGAEHHAVGLSVGSCRHIFFYIIHICS